MKTLLSNVDKTRRNGTWWVGRYSDGRLGAFWSCPTCGQCAGLKTHRIATDGEVSPSVICDKCGFHDFVTLDEVQPEVVTYSENTCPGHVASANDPKVCGRCGTHIDSLRPDDAAR